MIMGNRHDRLTKFGIVALAGIAVLGWVREPEKHQSSGSSVSATSPNGSAESRSTFYHPSAVAGVAGINELPGDNLQSFAPTIQRVKWTLRWFPRRQSDVWHLVPLKLPNELQAL